MKATVKFNLTIEVEIQTEKIEVDTSIMELQLKSSNLGNCLLDTLNNMKTRELLNSKINSDYTARITSVYSNKTKEIIIKT